ncbi:MAG: hypothetical protein ACR2MG_20965 [Pyrinomonadaceae bacterium]
MNETKNLKGDVSPFAPIDLLDSPLPAKNPEAVCICWHWRRFHDKDGLCKICGCPEFTEDV